MAELDKYITHHGLCTLGKNTDKVRRVIAHVSQLMIDINDVKVDNDEEAEEEEEIIAVIGEDTESEHDSEAGSGPEDASSDSDSELPVKEIQQRTSRSGRHITKNSSQGLL